MKDLSFEIQFYESVYKKLPDDAQVIEILGCLYSEVGRIDDGLKMDLKSVELDPLNPTTHYNLACSYALKDNQDDAVKELTQAVELGYNDLDWLLQDDDLKPMHNNIGFQKLIERLKNSPKAQ